MVSPRKTKYIYCLKIVVLDFGIAGNNNFASLVLSEGNIYHFFQTNFRSTSRKLEKCWCCSKHDNITSYDEFNVWNRRCYPEETCYVIENVCWNEVEKLVKLPWNER